MEKNENKVDNSFKNDISRQKSDLNKLVNIIREETTMWDEFIDPALMAYHTTKYATIGVTPFLLMYGREAVLPIDEPYNLHMRDRMMQIVEEVPHIREEARRMI